MKSLFFIFSFSFLLLPLISQDQEKPTPEEIKKVTRYYFEKNSVEPILVDAKICNDYVRQGKNRLECRFENKSASVPYGKEVFVWLNFFWNTNHKYNILVNYKLDDVVRRTYEHELPESGSIRYRIPLSFQANRKGTWLVGIFYEKNNKPVFLKNLEILVK